MNDTSTDTSTVLEQEAEFSPAVIGAMDSVPKDGEPEPMSDEEFYDRIKGMVPRVIKVSEIERDVCNAYEQRIACARRFAAAIKRGDMSDASQQLLRWMQLAERVTHHANRLSEKVARIVAEMEE